MRMKFKKKQQHGNNKTNIDDAMRLKYVMLMIMKMKND